MNPLQLKAALETWQAARAQHQQGRLREAEALYRKAMQMMPPNAELLSDYGRLAENLGDWRAAENIWRAAGKNAPERSFGDHLGLALLQQGKTAEALPVLEQHRTRQPSDAASLINLAVCLNLLDRSDEAIAVLREALHARPDYAQAHEALVTLLINGSDRDAASAALADARRLLPDNPELRYMQMEHFLKCGDYASGFDMFDARWHTRFVNAVVRLPRDRLWQGEPFDGRLLVRAEQGIGDELLYSSLLADLQQRHADTVVDCDERLLPLFARSYPALTFIPRQTPEDDPRRSGYARQCLMGDLPRLFRRAAGDFPSRAGWISPDPQRAEALRAGHSARFPGRLRVGLSWRSSHPGNGGAKSLSLDQLEPLLTLPGLQFFNLQYGDVRTELDAFAARTGIVIHNEPSVDPMNDLDGLAAEIATLDLVISTSNSTVHLAGALGTPVWVMLHRDRGLPWYWRYDGETVPWYPNTRLFRCPRRGEWAPVIAGIREQLTRLAAARPGR